MHVLVVLFLFLNGVVRNVDADDNNNDHSKRGDFYQASTGELCFQNHCYEGSYQDELVQHWLRYHHHVPQPTTSVATPCRADIVDARAFCHNVSASECNSSAYFQIMCPVTCQTCHDRVRTVPHHHHHDNHHAHHDSVQTTTTSSNKAQRERARNRRRSSIMSMSKSREQVWSYKVVTAVTTDFGVPQEVPHHTNYNGYRSSSTTSNRMMDMDAAVIDQFYNILDEANSYILGTVRMDDQFFSVRDKCRNRHGRCAVWAMQGYCKHDEEDNDSNNHLPQQLLDHVNMAEECAPMCRTCDQLHYFARCPVNQNIKNAWYPGDLNRMFERIVVDPTYQMYHNVTVLSRPQSSQDIVANMTHGGYGLPEDSPDGPWLIVLDNFTKPDEAAALIELGSVLGYERSEDVGDEDESGEVDSVVSSGRTSTNAWCEEVGCEDHPLVMNLIERMEQLTGIPLVYTEYMQLLRYEVGQFYNEHHDYIELDRMRYSGVRILTVFLYLNTVEDGGETDFPKLGMAVQPKLGRVVLWPSVLDDEPHLIDDRTNHQAMPVKRGIKFGANAWYHQRHFRSAHHLSC